MRRVMRAWNVLPVKSKFFFSNSIASLAKTGVSQVLPRLISYDSTRFVVPNGQRYRSFYEFFVRELKSYSNEFEFIYPCQGRIVDLQEVKTQNQMTTVKGVHLNLKDIFANDIPQGYYFVNIFLNSFDYHRIHSPTCGEVLEVKRIPGDLILLKPYLYSNPTKPAFVNERVNVKIKDDHDRIWYVSIVGGPGVATINMENFMKVGCRITTGLEIAHFTNGSTCCIAAPIKPRESKGDRVFLNEF